MAASAIHSDGGTHDDDADSAVLSEESTSRDIYFSRTHPDQFHHKCDICIGNINDAAKYCKTCKASYCVAHLADHYKTPVFSTHEIVHPNQKPKVTPVKSSQWMRSGIVWMMPVILGVLVSQMYTRVQYGDVTQLQKQKRELNAQLEERDKQLEKYVQLEKKRLTELQDMRRIKGHAVDVTLDPDTANPFLIISADGKQVRHGDTLQYFFSTKNRFSHVVSVLGKQGFSTGQFYYEVQVKGKTDWSLGVARESITMMTEKITLSPDNGYWTILLRNGNEYKAAASHPVPLSLKQKPQRVGVFVDYEAGLVSFYDADCWYHLYSYTNVKFTETLYPYFSPNKGGENSSPLIISTVSFCPVK
ncbi:erythroid membrane-associated protein-like isoform X2 [Sardina pilchardus]|uniref:erythroid membrane-associated protein-like isoform X2 n=1 Tax=Sardina pilchardus TaxID=27697 RepID=UPI002E151976